MAKSDKRTSLQLFRINYEWKRFYIKCPTIVNLCDFMLQVFQEVFIIQGRCYKTFLSALTLTNGKQESLPLSIVFSLVKH